MSTGFVDATGFKVRRKREVVHIMEWNGPNGNDIHFSCNMEMGRCGDHKFGTY